MQGTRFLRQAVASQPRGIATISGDRKRTWTEVGDRVPRLAAALWKTRDCRRRVRCGARLQFRPLRRALLCHSLGRRRLCAAKISAGPRPRTPMRSGIPGGVCAVCGRELHRPSGSELGFLKTLVFMGEGETPEGMLSYEQLIFEQRADGGRQPERRGSLGHLLHRGNHAPIPRAKRDDVASGTVRRDARLSGDAARHRGAEIPLCRRLLPLRGGERAPLHHNDRRGRMSSCQNSSRCRSCARSRNTRSPIWCSCRR